MACSISFFLFGLEQLQHLVASTRISAVDCLGAVCTELRPVSLGVLSSIFFFVSRVSGRLQESGARRGMEVSNAGRRWRFIGRGCGLGFELRPVTLSVCRSLYLFLLSAVLRT